MLSCVFVFFFFVFFSPWSGGFPGVFREIEGSIILVSPRGPRGTPDETGTPHWRGPRALAPCPFSHGISLSMVSLNLTSSQALAHWASRSRLIGAHSAIFFQSSSIARPKRAFKNSHFGINIIEKLAGAALWNGREEASRLGSDRKLPRGPLVQSRRTSQFSRLHLKVYSKAIKALSQFPRTEPLWSSRFFCNPSKAEKVDYSYFPRNL